MNESQPPSIEFGLTWIDRSNGTEYTTLASIRLTVDGTPVWPVKGEDADDFEWFADELLSHLTECWKSLLLRQNYPIPVLPERPSFLVPEAVKRWAEFPNAKEHEESELAAFEDVHDLSNAFGGVSGLLPLWFLRDQDKMMIDTQELFLQVPFDEAVSALVSVGNAIAARLQKADEQRWSKLLRAWNRRDEGSTTLLLALTIGRDQSTAAALIANNVLAAPKSLKEAANDLDELRIAARMAGPLPLNQIKSIIKIVRSCRRAERPVLDDVAKRAREFLVSNGLKNSLPHVQGNELAIWVRRTLNLSADSPVDPQRILDRHLGVDVRAIDFKIGSLDAVAVWGPKHGPAVLVNMTSNRICNRTISIWKNGAFRVTAAHELCHLIVDSTHTLSAVDVLGGRMPPRIEQRARAFAAEFLLPSSEAGAAWIAEGRPLELETLRKVISRLRRRFNVTDSVAAWQVEHDASSDVWRDLHRALDELVPQR